MGTAVPFVASPGKNVMRGLPNRRDAMVVKLTPSSLSTASLFTPTNVSPTS